MSPTPSPDSTFDAFLFDSEGTIINSIAAAERAWGAWAGRHGIDD
jgi:sugar-phosphatase